MAKLKYDASTTLNWNGWVDIGSMKNWHQLLNYLYVLRSRLSEIEGLRIFAGLLPEHPDDKLILCSECFQNHGLKLDARYLGVNNPNPCPNCGSTSGRKLSRWILGGLTKRFFHWGTMVRCEYGAAPVVVFNEVRDTDLDPPLPWLDTDMRLIEKTLGVGFFNYGPRLWMIGEFEALHEFTDVATRSDAVKKVLEKYPAKTLKTGELFYRIRKAPKRPSNPDEYDSPPKGVAGKGRLDSLDLPVMYGSPDLQVCVHECRVTAEDELFVATLAPKRDLRLIDLTELIVEEGVTEFESVDLAVHMLFLAGDHSYEIARAIAKAAHSHGFDGVIYPSYFSLLRTGGMPFETVLGISHRRIPRFAERERSKTIANYAIFGRPVEDGLIEAKGINRLILNQVEYGFHFGPVGFTEGF